jgi:hypothetical protein
MSTIKAKITMSKGGKCLLVEHLDKSHHAVYADACGHQWKQTLGNGNTV